MRFRPHPRPLSYEERGARRPHPQTLSFLRRAQDGERGGSTLIELIVAVGLGVVIMGVGYRAYFGLMRADEVEEQRHQAMLTVRNVQGKIERDVREAQLVAAFGNSLVLNPSASRICYMSGSKGVTRSTHKGNALFKGVRARFTAEGGGVRVKLWSEARIHRRPIRVESSTFVLSRNG